VLKVRILDTKDHAITKDDATALEATYEAHVPFIMKGLMKAHAED